MTGDSQYERHLVAHVTQSSFPLREPERRAFGIGALYGLVCRQFRARSPRNFPGFAAMNADHAE